VAVLVIGWALAIVGIVKRALIIAAAWPAERNRRAPASLHIRLVFQGDG
jgi:hypothetical protein